MRDWYNILAYDLQDGHCSQCGHAVAGVFEARPGEWGAKRAVVKMSALHA